MKSAIPATLLEGPGGGNPVIVNEGLRGAIIGIIERSAPMLADMIINQIGESLLADRLSIQECGELRGKSPVTAKILFDFSAAKDDYDQPDDLVRFEIGGVELDRSFMIFLDNVFDWNAEYLAECFAPLILGGLRATGIKRISAECPGTKGAGA